MNLDTLQRFKLDDKDYDYTASETILYALGLGYGSDPTDEEQLAFVYEKGLKAVPSMCNTIAHPGFWIDRPELAQIFRPAGTCEASHVLSSSQSRRAASTLPHD